MRQIFTLISCFALSVITAAQSPAAGEIIIKMRATVTPSTDTPLIVIDGILCYESDLKKIDPNNIESINILKEVSSALIFCNSSHRGVIIITTKNANQRVIKVKYILTGEVIPGATIELNYKESNKDTVLRMQTDSTGYFITNKIVYGKEYGLKVSSVGYKGFKTIVTSSIIGKDYSVLLERNYSKLDEVIVTANSAIRTIRCWNGVAIKRAKDSEQKIIAERSIRIFPNPVTPVQKINLEFISDNERKLTLRLFGIDSKLINSKEYSVMGGINRFEYPVDSKLAQGLYIFQVIDANDKLIRSEKLIMQ